MKVGVTVSELITKYELRSRSVERVNYVIIRSDVAG